MNASKALLALIVVWAAFSAAQPANAVKELPRPGGPSTSPPPPPQRPPPETFRGPTQPVFKGRPPPPDPGRPGTRGQAEDMKSVCDVAPPCPSGCTLDAASHKCTEWQAP